MDSPRRLRAKERKHYSDEGIDDDEIEGKRSFDVLDKLQSEQYNGDFVETLTGADFTLEYVQRTGMSKPIVIHDKTGLGMRIPSTSFKVSDVKQCVGSRRMLDVMDVNTQKGLEMSMKEWVKYYENENRDRLLNVISLEFSHTRLETYVESPTVVRQVDWVDSVWPRHLKEIHTEATNIIEKMKYPKVQKYCLMSVAGCFTDFHVDFGGTSVWYHILHGEKVFWLIPPTEENMEMYENWVLSGKQSDVFLADTVSDCQKIVLKAGYTFMIPSGWIHAVYTPKDSLVFGGNFIHSFNILQQLRVSEMEDRTRVPQKFRYPFYTEVMWYVLAQYLRCLSGKSYLHSPGKENSVAKNGPVKSEIDDNETDNKPTVKSENDTDNVETKMSNGLDSTPGTPRPGTPRPNRRGAGSRAATPVTENGDAEESSFSGSASKDKLKNENSPKGDGDEANSDKWVHLTPYELKGLTKLIEWLENLPASKRGVPKDVIDAEVLIDDIKALLVKHASDDHSKAITGQEVIKWPPSATKLIKPKPVKQPGGGKPGKLGKNAAGNRRRRTRCKKCPACMRGDCGECHFCKDMKKFGGPGRMKQSCISKKCMAPELPNSATCIICETDERVQNDSEEGEGTVTTLMECGVCWEIVHPACLSERYTGLDNEGVINEDLPNSWECPKCSGNVDPSKLKISPKAKSAKGTNSEEEGEEGEEADAPESGSSEEEAEDTKKGNKKLHSLEGKRVTSKVGSISKLKSVSLGTKRGKMKQAIMLSTSLKKKAVVPTKIKPVTKTKAPPKVEPRGLKSPPVVTRSGRTVVAKRAPDEDDDMFFSPIKRQRKEELSVSPVRGKGRGKRGLGSSPGATGRGQGMRVRSLNETATPGSRGGKSRGRGRGGRGGASASASQSTRISSSPSDSNRSSRAGTPLRGDKNSPSESGKGKKQKTPAKGQTAATTTTTSEEKPPEKEVKIIPPKYVIRPVPIPPPADFLDLNDGEKHQLPRTMWLKVFRYLHHSDLARCMSVCKNWNRWCINKSLWYELDLSHKKIKQVHLVGIVRRQPTVLNLNYAVIAPKQLSWLTERLPHLKNLSLAYCSWATLAALCCSSCPFLTYLDLSWASGLKDACFIDLISPAPDSRPAVRIVSRLHKLVELQMAGTDISDDSLQLVPKQLTNLQKLDLSYCIKLTNQAIEYLTDEGTATRYNLKELDLTGCNQLTADCLTFLANCPNLVRLKLKACHKICVEDCQAFTMTYVHRKLTLRDDFDKLIVCAETEEPMET